MEGLVSIVVPVYNESGSVEPLLVEIDAAMAELGRPYEVVFVDDGSDDGTFATLEALAAGSSPRARRQAAAQLRQVGGADVRLRGGARRRRGDDGR